MPHQAAHPSHVQQVVTCALVGVLGPVAVAPGVQRDGISARDNGIETIRSRLTVAEEGLWFRARSHTVSWFRHRAGTVAVKDKKEGRR